MYQQDMILENITYLRIKVSNAEADVVSMNKLHIIIKTANDKT